MEREFDNFQQLRRFTAGVSVLDSNRKYSLKGPKNVPQFIIKKDFAFFYEEPNRQFFVTVREKDYASTFSAFEDEEFGTFTVQRHVGHRFTFITHCFKVRALSQGQRRVAAFADL